MNPFYNNFIIYPFMPGNCNKPPTIFTILNSIVNGQKINKLEKTKVKDLAKVGRTTIFNFDYPLSNNVSREAFETMILNHFLMRRIGFDTVTLFNIQLNVKLNEIMPFYNKMFDALENWDIFNDGEKTVKSGTDNRKTENTSNTTNSSNSSNSLNNESNTNTTNISDRRHSDNPQNAIENVRDGVYVTDYNYDNNQNTGHDTSKSNGSSESSSNSESKNNTTDDNIYNETVTRTPADKIAILREMQTNIKNIYTMIFEELESLFYSIE